MYPIWFNGDWAVTLCRNRMSVTTPVPALARKALFGRRIAPRSSARSAMYLRTAGFFLSIVPDEVMNATTPPGRTLSKVFAKSSRELKNGVCHIVCPLRHNLQTEHCRWRDRKAVGQTGFFKTFNRNVRRLIELPCDSACDRVQFHTVELTVLHAFGQQTKKLPIPQDGSSTLPVVKPMFSMHL